MAGASSILSTVMSFPAIPSFLEEYLLEPAPVACGVLPGSTPVVSFGDARTAKVATLGLNPSLREFGSGGASDFAWLSESDRRLATLQSVGIANTLWPSQAPIEAITSVVGACNDYFRRNPYRRWFDPLDEILRQLGHTYYGSEPSACHLDLSPWASNPVWRKLGAHERVSLIDNGRQLLESELSTGHIELLLINGATVTKATARAFNLSFEEVGPRVDVPGKRTSSATLWADLRGVTVIAWSVNLQSSFGVSNGLKQKLAERVGEIVSQRTSSGAP